MGKVVSLESYRLALSGASSALGSPAAEVEREEPVRTGNRGVANACRDMADGFRQMKAACQMLNEATAELRELLRGDAEGLA